MNGPFGAPDARIDVAPRPPFELTDLPAYIPLATGRSDPLARVLVGRPGSGKTRYLVELRDRLKAEAACDLADVESDLPSLTLVTRLAEDLAPDPVERAEIWGRIWECAVVAAVLGWNGIAPGSSPPSIYREFGHILRDHQTLPELREFLYDAVQDERYSEFERAIASRPRPVCFFLDMVEENSAHSPLYWLWCQKALVRLVLNLATKPELADKLHIFVAIRERTWAELKRRTATLDMHPAVRVLTWDASLMLDFLTKKVQRLPEKYMLGDHRQANSASLIAAWLGSDTVQNAARPLREPTARYLLRHTRLIPRDLVTVGNLLAALTYRARRRGETGLSDQQIQTAVSQAAQLSAAEELTWCGLEILGEQLAYARDVEARRQILTDEDKAIRTTDELRELLTGIGQDVVPQERIDALEADAQDRFGDSIELGPLLWRHGLIGWGADPNGPFTFMFVHPDDTPPSGAYAAMHPCLIDALKVRAATEVPVEPFLPDAFGQEQGL